MGAANYGTSVSHNFCISTVGIEDNSIDGQIAVFPNPANDVINLNFRNKDLNVLSVEIFDVRGAQLSLIANPSTQENLIISVDGLTNGIYLVKINTDKGTSVKKFAKK
jgi:hypothetical protein